ncbi:MAG: HipA domain-containing protein, partial [Thermoleophilaceae bacterium]|nr:HipA domain-containing protein [Thermoleophilaceae bacterium]
LAGAYSYEQAIMVMRRLELSIDQIEQQFRRMVFNVIARNQDDHVKNIAYLMDRRGQWQLSPAFDLTYSYQPSGEWTSQHQMTINAKRDNFVVEDFRHCAEAAALKKGRAAEILEEVRVAVDNWPSFAAKAKVTTTQAERIAATHRLDIQP